MEQKKENEWTKSICELLRKELDTNKYEITCLERVPYRANIVGFDDNGKEKIEYMKYQTDLLIKEIVNEMEKFYYFKDKTTYKVLALYIMV